jgi:hypothetical protein
MRCLMKVSNKEVTMAMYDEATATMGGGTSTIEKPKTRQEKIEEWRNTHRGEYIKACEDNCTCTPTRAQMLMIDQWDSPPVD